ncbi:hypothetical protein O181_020151 [Austropuccinia psidii MF-1]|uniref:Uncharacterized protein n=1 Tax=Austropuccinia psidii MF-1 TaxID=1389203 RepID=A0A9Q3C8I9_9BASI|nr:hypothetical protein [Austropuccinia psidii MF-1]
MSTSRPSSPLLRSRPSFNNLNSNHHLHPSRESRPPSIFKSIHHKSSNPSSNQQRPQTKSFKAPVPFNRLQLAAALIEYDHSQNGNPNNDQHLNLSSTFQIENSSEINWSLQNPSNQVTLHHQVKQAALSAIFIPFRQTIQNSKSKDFFSDLSLPIHQSNLSNNNSGFSLVSKISNSHVPLFSSGHIRESLDGLIETVSNHNQINLDHKGKNKDNDNKIALLSVWGLDNLLSDSNQTKKNQAPTPQINQLDHLASIQLKNRSDVKSDLFDFHFSQIRLESQNPSSSIDFFSDDKINNLNNSTQLTNFDSDQPIDDETLLRQRIGHDPAGRQIWRPQSVMELRDFTDQFNHLKFSKNLQNHQRSVFKQAHSRSRANSGIHIQTNTKLRTQSISSNKLVNNNPHHQRKSQLSRSKSYRCQSKAGNLPRPGPFESTNNTTKSRPRRKSTFDIPSSNPLNLITPLQGLSKCLHHRCKSLPSLPHPSTLEDHFIRSKKSSTNTVSSPPHHSIHSSKGPSLASHDVLSESKIRKRTSADIVQRYKESMALLENQEEIESGSKTRKSFSLSTNLINPMGSNTNSQLGESKFSLGAPKDFTSRFDPKVTSVLTQVSTSRFRQRDDSDGFDARSLDEHYNKAFEYDQDNDNQLADEIDDQEDKGVVYEELGRIRFPTALKPLVLIMPIPLTPAEPEPEVEPDPIDQVVEDDQNRNLEEIQTPQKLRPAGRLYGRSLIDELNSRKGAPKSRQPAFAGGGRPKMFSNHLSTQDITRPGSIYSSFDPAFNENLFMPKSTHSKLFMANQAKDVTQIKFNQALINSSKARKSVFGMDKIMLAELEKLKKIKAEEDKEMRELEAKAEAKEAKKQLKKGKKKVNVLEEHVGVIDKTINRISHMNDWDTMLEKANRSPIPASPSSLPAPSPALPPMLIPPVICSDQMSDIGNWFNDKSVNEIHPSINQLDKDDGKLGNVHSLAPKLELQAEGMDYKPFTNEFNDLPIRHQVLAKNEAESFLFSARAHTPIQGFNNTGGGESDGDQEDHEPLVSVARHKRERQSRLHQSMLRNVNQVTNADDDDVPLSKHQKSTLIKPSNNLDEDDNRPLSQIVTKPFPMVTSTYPLPRKLNQKNLDQCSRYSHLPHRHPDQMNSVPPSASDHDTDEELPLGIRATILLAKSHPPIDLTTDDLEEPIGSGGSDQSDDDIPLGVRALHLPALDSEQLHTPLAVPISTEGSEKVEREVETSSDEDNVPLGYRVSKPPLFLEAQHAKTHKDLMNLGFNPQLAQVMASSSKSIGGKSDDIPLGVKCDDDIPLAKRASTLNPMFSFPNKSNLNYLYNPNNQMISTYLAPQISTISDEDDDNDDVPLAQRPSMLPSKSQTSNHDIGAEIKVKSSNSSNEDDSKISSSPDGVASFLRKEKEKSDNPPASEMKSDTARQNTLAALEGRVNPDEEHEDDDVPLGVTRAAHTSMSGLQAIQTKKKQKETSVERDELKPTAPDGESLQDSRANNDDDDDVPLGIQSQLNLRQSIAQNNSMMIENTYLSTLNQPHFPSSFIQQPHHLLNINLFPPPPTQSFNFFNPNQLNPPHHFYDPNQHQNPKDEAYLELISKWRKDIE